MKKLILFLMVISCVGLLAGCFLRPYVATVQQGNELTQSQVAHLRIGMSKKAVRSVLGAPVLQNAFNDNYWTYISTKQINGGKIAKRKLVLHFKHDRLVRIVR